ncbi:MAG: right-handed parallel beta-helix repeat-containing protein [Sedimentisphaerales bacterium]|nr:right-handed parallel beta-helix repeat-containing protein [Sedimentisphaerales bacterium]
MKNVLWDGLIGLAVLSSVSPAAVRRVPAQYRSIQQAISDCTDGDTVIVSPGVYYETINFSGKNVVLTSTDPNDPKIVGYTIIDADGDGTVVTFENGETSEAVLTGFTITGGVGTLEEGSEGSYKFFTGGGICCRWGSPTITRNVIRGNHMPFREEMVDDTFYLEYSFGGAIYAVSGCTITHNVIYNNSAFEGGGICVYEGIVANNIIYHNSAGYGGGVYIGFGCLVNNTIVANDCSLYPDYGCGGNVYAEFGYDEDLTVANNVICGAESGGGLYCVVRPHKDLIRFNDVWNNTPGNYGTQDSRTGDSVFGDSADWTGQFGNISEDPRFVDVWNNTYRISADSPCISAGDPVTIPASGRRDIDEDPRIFAVRVDIGADEYVGYVKPLAVAGADQHVLAPQPITLDGGDSYFSDPNGVKTYRWTQKDGSAVELTDATAVQPAFTPADLGWYRFELVVGDGQYMSKADEVLVIVGNAAPVANAGSDSLVAVPAMVALDGSASHDGDPMDRLTYTWTQIEGPGVTLLNADSASPFFLSGTPGIYVFQLVVSDGFVSSGPDTVRLQTSTFTCYTRSVLQTDSAKELAYYPDTSGTRIVYAAGDSLDTSWVINCLDTRTDKVVTFEGGGTDTMPRIDGDLVVWWGGQGVYYEPVCTSIFWADLAVGTPRYLRQATQADSYGYPAISGNRIVWLEFHGVNTRDLTGYDRAWYDLCGVDMTDPARPVYFTIAEQAGRCPPYPYVDFRRAYADMLDISGNIVVWEHDGDIFGADISDLSRIRTFPICTAPLRQRDPAVSGHLVVWTDERDDMGDIYGADISDPNAIREFKVDATRGMQTQPDIDGALIAFSYGSEDGGEIRACCVSREYGVVPIELPAFEGEGYTWFYGSAPKVDGTTITWQRSSRVWSISLEFGYTVASGPVENLATGTCYDYIQHAIDAASDTDVIAVKEGTYHEKLCFRGRAVTVTSTDARDRHVCANTILEGAGQLVTFADGEDSNSVLSGFTIRGGSFGIYCGASSPTISNCTITGHASAGIKLWDQADPTIARSEIAGNGTGVTMWEQRGGRFTRVNRATFHNCLVVGNRKDGIWGGRPTIQNCTIADNTGYGVNSVLVTANSSILYFNHPGAQNLRIESTASILAYCDIEGGSLGEGNIDADPLFVRRGVWLSPSSVVYPAFDAVWETGDYHLRSEGWTWDAAGQNWSWYDATSPCIDTGDPDLSFENEPKCEQNSPLCERGGANLRIDMGAYGGTAEASLAPR